MKPYEDTYLQKRVSTVIERQKQGKIVIAAYEDGTGLPTRQDLPTIKSSSYPHDYAVGDVGYLDYDSQVGAYIFTPKPGADLPKALAHYRTLALGEAMVRVASRQAIIRVKDTEITFTGVPVWEPGYNLLKEINSELTRANAGVIVWKITWDEQGVGQEHRLFPGAAPRLRNGQALVHLTGFAYDEDHTLVYAGAVGYKTSLESIRATLLTAKQLTLNHDQQDIYLSSLDRYEQVWQVMPEYTSHHTVYIGRQALPGKWDPEDQFAYLLVFQSTADPRHEMLRLFAERMKETLEIPVLDDWSAALWKAAKDQGYIRELVTAGDCLKGFRLHLKADWQGLITSLLKEETIAL
ncbi:MAG TPA: hypothetical protein PKD23_04145 [Bellilinea sp.]|nr:hypothetical protein [Bellilinea sp.]